jgi:hypothetical protein
VRPSVPLRPVRAEDSVRAENRPPRVAPLCESGEEGAPERRSLWVVMSRVLYWVSAGYRLTIDIK